VVYSRLDCPHLNILMSNSYSIRSRTLEWFDDYRRASELGGNV